MESCVFCHVATNQCVRFFTFQSKSSLLPLKTLSKVRLCNLTPNRLMALSAGKQHSMAQQQGSVPIHYFFAKSHTHEEQNRGRKYYYTHIYKQIHSQLLTYDSRNVLVNSLEGSWTNVLSVLWLTFHADQCAKLSSCSALTEIPGRVCIPVRVAGKPCSTLALRECVGVFVCFPQSAFRHGAVWSA